VRAEVSSNRLVARRRRARRLALQRAAAAAVAIAVLALAFGLVYAGSPSTLAEGTTIAGVNVGGLRPAEAEAVLRARADLVRSTPVVLRAGSERLSVSAAALAVETDWAGAVSTARARSDGFGPFRGFRRLHTRVFGEEIAPAVAVSEPALERVLDRVADAVDRPQTEAALRLDGDRVVVEPARPGRRLERTAAAATIVHALASLRRDGPVVHPVDRLEPAVTRADLRPALRSARLALSRPVRLVHRGASWTLDGESVGRLLVLPAEGRTDVAVGGSGLAAYLDRLAEAIDREPRDATFAVKPGGIGIVPHEPGLTLDRRATAAAIQRAAFSPGRRSARVVVAVSQPARTTREAQAMGITDVVSSYTTTYGGTPGRLHNVELVARLVDDTLIPPGTVFSFNATTGERNAERGFQEAPVIINGELQDGIGGGVCQVSTTVFNAAFEAGLSIESRTNHALYISHYPLGRDATVNYPDIDLRFTNDTGKWLLLRTFVGPGSLTVNLYGAPLSRRVETETSPLVAVGETPVEEIRDPTLERGRRVVETPGAPPRATSVRRWVYEADGTLLYDSTWHSSYVAEPEVVRVGTKKPSKPSAEEPSVDVPPVPGAPGVVPGSPPTGPAAPAGAAQASRPA
jgi:vancomycin resistance protein YoaR